MDTLRNSDDGSMLCAESPETQIPSEWDDALYLKEYADVRFAVEAGRLQSGYHHFVLHGLIEGRKPTWKSVGKEEQTWPWSDYLYLRANPSARWETIQQNCTPWEHYIRNSNESGGGNGLEGLRQSFLDRTSFPDWLAKEMESLSYFEPGLDLETYKAPKIYNPFAKEEWAAKFLEVREYLRHEKYDFLFFLPWIKKGGADLASLFHVHSVSRQYDRIAVFTTENAPSEWASRLPKSVDLVPFGELFQGIDMDQQSVLCYHMVAALSPAKIHIINSHAAWNLLNSNSAALAAMTEIYVSLYCYDYDKFGEPVGYARNIRRSAMNIKAIFTDNCTFRDHLSEELGVPYDKIHVLPHPVAMGAREARVSKRSTNILWASRLDRQKQPEILVQLARSLPGLTFHVFGHAVMGDASNIIEAFRQCPNIIYRGPFDSATDILEEEYRCFLYTSLWDGLPNILLEMLWAGMLVIAPDVGGIGASLGTDKCVLVADAKDASQYVLALTWVFENTEAAEKIRCNGQEYVHHQHTWDNFNRILSEAKYLEVTNEQAMQ